MALEHDVPKPPHRPGQPQRENDPKHPEHKEPEQEEPEHKEPEEEPAHHKM